MKISEIVVSYKPQRANRPKITCSGDAFEILRPIYDPLIEYKEAFKVLMLSTANRVIALYNASEGGLAGTVVDVRQIMAIALKANAAGLIVAHNHPSGSIYPSKSDIGLTTKIKDACNFFDIKLLDHIILTTENYYSFADSGEL